ncbi:MAG: 3-isopropylmalate dehydratase [Synergistaceae bacterium]|jgi:3-isopropylmalate/(R)-2-methylmalate dehydratase small subunit|nr:3-isopropylmalate dehydratase [Synergistaceae bacterium]
MIRDSVSGRAWKFGDNVSTDSIAPGRLISLRANPPEYAKHLLEDVNPEFAKNVAVDDFIVAGVNFGCGSSREIAPMIIKISGVGAVLAKSFGRIFYRNAVNNGMLLIECDTDKINDGEVITADILGRRITAERGLKIPFNLSESEIKIINEGGLLNYIEKYNSLDI